MPESTCVLKCQLEKYHSEETRARREPRMTYKTCINRVNGN